LAAAGALRWRAGRIAATFTPPVAESPDGLGLRGSLIEAFAIYVVWFLAVGPLGLWLSGGKWRGLWSAIAGLAPVACLWPLVRGARFDDLRRSLGWTRGAGLLREMGCGVVGYVAGTPLMVVGIAATVLLSQATGQQPSHPAMNWIVLDFRRLAAILALVSVYAPLAEETLFRGALYAGVRGYWGSAASAILVAFVFAALHPQGWTAIPVLMSIAVVLGILREWRGSSIASMTAHALNNAAVTLVFALVAG
jgi:membrane protease YdiL (CAAX protease family)